MITFKPTTPVMFYKKETGYIEGEGHSSKWTPVTKSPLYCEWRGTFGQQLMSAQAMGVNDSATVRTFYHPAVYAALRAEHVVVVKNAVSDIFKNGRPDKNDPNVYELWGGVDNISEENRFMEFKVRRYEGK